MSAPGKKPQYDPSLLVLYAAAYLFVVFIVMRFYPPLAIALFALGIGLGLAFLIYRLFSSEWSWIFRGRRKREPYDFQSRVLRRLKDCREKEERFRQEAEGIRNSIRQLRDDMERSVAADEHEKERGEGLVKELKAEFDLRHAKASFFAECATKLQQLLDRHRLHESINARKKELESLRQTNFDDEAAVEETRYHLEQDSIELNTIAELSRDVAISFKAEQAEALRARLDKLRTNL